MAKLFEKLPVLGAFNTFASGTEKLDAAFLQNPLFFKLHGKVEPRLSADTGHDGVGTLIPEDFGNIFKSERLHINLIGNGCIGHDGSGIGIAENHFVPLFF